MKEYTFDEIHNMTKKEVEEHLQELLKRRRKADQENDIMESQWVSRTIDWLERLLKHKKWE
jgi:hypothetical protein